MVQTAAMIVGIDIGGTFTDLVCCESGRVTSIKVPSTPDDFSIGFSDAVSEAVSDEAVIDQIVHATTVATNALIQRKGARVGMITTEGFRDVLSLRRRDRRSAYGLETAFSPLVPRALRREVKERSSPDGILVPVEDAEILEVAAALWADGVEAILIAFLHSTTCPENEQRAHELVSGEWPDRLVFASHAVSSAPTEFERFSTGAASAYVAPLVTGYLDGIQTRLNLPGRLSIVTSDGGLVEPETATLNPIRTVLSGPAAGVWGARHVCDAAGLDAFVACDMGGTSFDACLVTAGVPSLTGMRELDFGIPLAVEMLDIATIGAGGGSIVTVTPAGNVEVGPEGVGANPGPACYGNQVHQATVTDADLLLGRIATSLRLPSGERKLDIEAARKTINERVAQPIGVSAEEAAGLIVSTVEEKMADQIRTMGLNRRVDVSDHVLFAYGGAGPLHAAGIAGPLGILRIVIPTNAGLFSAWGGLLTRGRQTVTTPCAFGLNKDAEYTIKRTLEDHLDQLSCKDLTDVSHSVELGVAGQSRSLSVPVSVGDTYARLLERFQERTGTGVSEVRVSQVSTVAVSPVERTLDDVIPAITPVEEKDLGVRDVRFSEDGWVPCPVLHRGGLGPDDSGEGPCVIEEPGATTLVPAGFSWRVGSFSLLHVDRLA
jgi:N-methylhydantoinase A